MSSNWIVALVVGVSVVSISACDSANSSSPTSPSSTTSPASGLNLSGTWTGSFSSADGAASGSGIQLKWTATQSGANVSGPIVLTVEGDDEGEEDTVVNGTMSGTVSGAELTSTRFTVAAGSIPIPELSTCTISGTGTHAATTASISGPMAMTFGPAGAPCVGQDSGVSNTPTDTWQLSLTK
jgi:hypothetical protein